MKKTFFAFLATAFLFSCKKDKDESSNFSGPQSEVHHGKAWTSVKLNKDGVPEKLVLSLDAATLATVPVGEGDGSGGHDHENHIIVNLPEQALASTPFKFILLDWNAMGHEPAGIYDLPHFDMHFYMTPANEVMNYVDAAKLQAAPPADYVPANHISGAPVPTMGLHWLDVTSPELNGQLFTQTFIYGSYDSKVVFYEPMITLDFLKNTTNFERPIPQPAKFKTAGYYPTKMRIYKEAGGTTNVSLEGFVYRQAS